MAIDGPKIIDSDLAHDIYNEFMELYDSGLPIEEIRIRLQSWVNNLVDSLEVEIYHSVLCEALWETGFLQNKDSTELHQLLETGEGLKIWTSIDINMASERKNVLKKQLKKIATPRPKPRKIRKFRVIDKFIFNEGDVISYLSLEKRWYLLFVYSIDQHRGECLYSMGIIDYQELIEPTFKDFSQGKYVGHKISTTLNNVGFIFGIAAVRPEHRELIKYSSRFIVIGNVIFDKQMTSLGSYSGVITHDNFEQDIVRIINSRKIFNREVFEVNRICI